MPGRALSGNIVGEHCQQSRSRQSVAGPGCQGKECCAPPKSPDPLWLRTSTEAWDRNLNQGGPQGPGGSCLTWRGSLCPCLMGRILLVPRLQASEADRVKETEGTNNKLFLREQRAEAVHASGAYRGAFVCQPSGAPVLHSTLGVGAGMPWEATDLRRTGGCFMGATLRGSCREDRVALEPPDSGAGVGSIQRMAGQWGTVRALVPEWPKSTPPPPGSDCRPGHGVGQRLIPAGGRGAAGDIHQSGHQQSSHAGLR